MKGKNVVESGEPTTKDGHTCFPIEISHHTSQWMLRTYNNEKVICVLILIYSPVILEQNN
jgi:hypothetical protein